MLLVVKEKDLHLTEDIFIASQLFGAARQLYPEITSVIAVSGSLYEHVAEETLQVANVDVHSPRGAHDEREA